MAIVLMVTTMGITIHQHYCGTRLVKTTLFHPPASCCEMPDCCHDESVTLSLKTDFTLDVLPIEQVTQFSMLHPVYEIASLLTSTNNSTGFAPDPDPPPLLRYTLAMHQCFRL